MRRICFLCVGFLTSAVATSYAQLVHLSVQGTPGFRRDYVSAPFYVTDESVMTLDIYYDPALPRNTPHDPEDVGGFTPTDPTKNFFRIRVDSPEGSGWDADFTRPLESIVATQNELYFRFTDYEDAYEEFNFVFAFAEPISWETLPTPPFPSLDLMFEQRDELFFGGPDVYGTDHPDSQWNYGALYFSSTDRFSAELVSGITPVPEPSTYGMLGAVGLLGVVWWRRRKAGRTSAA